MNRLPVETTQDTIILKSSIAACTPEYRSDLLEAYIPTRSLSPTTQGFLSVPKSFTSTYGDRVFSLAAPKFWDNLPASIRTMSLKGRSRPTSFRTHFYSFFVRTLTLGKKASFVFHHD